MQRLQTQPILHALPCFRMATLKVKTLPIGESTMNWTILRFTLTKKSFKKCVDLHIGRNAMKLIYLMFNVNKNSFKTCVDLHKGRNAMKPTFLMFYCIETSFNASLAFYIGAKCHQWGFYLNLHLRRQTLYQVLRFIRGQSATKPIFLMFSVKKRV